MVIREYSVKSGVTDLQKLVRAMPPARKPHGHWTRNRNDAKLEAAAVIRDYFNQTGTLPSPQKLDEIGLAGFYNAHFATGPGYTRTPRYIQFLHSIGFSAEQMLTAKMARFSRVERIRDAISMTF